ncbi:hypothetical protein HK096_010422, partial [Nowakowskiella sp. JEL0078]
MSDPESQPLLPKVPSVEETSSTTALLNSQPATREDNQASTPRFLPVIAVIPTLAYFCGIIITITLISVLVIIILGNTTRIRIIEKIIGHNLPPHCDITGIEVHLKSLDGIAATHGNRAVGAGHEASADYVVSQLSGLTGYFGKSFHITKQYFDVPVWKENRSPKVSISGGWTIELINGIDVRSMRYGGPSAVINNAIITHVPSGGCDDSNFDDFPSGSVALIKAGEGCDPWIASHSAEKSGAIAVAFYNPSRFKSLLGSRVRIVEWKKDDPLMGIPVLSLSHSVGEFLKTVLETSFISIDVDNTLEVVETFNVFADTIRGNPDEIVIVGSHLDGVPEGPGLVDNGSEINNHYFSGSSAVLEVAIQLHKTGIINKWGAEEIGLLGSRHYVRDLLANQPDEFAKIVLSINHDMLGSPNGIPYILDGYSAPEAVRNQSLAISEIYKSYWNFTHPVNAKNFIPEIYELRPMIAGSDFLPFVSNGIPTSGLETGAGELVTREQADNHKTRKVIANAAHDPCYHQKCDGISNVNRDLIEELTKLVAHAVEVFGRKDDLRNHLVLIGSEIAAKVSKDRGYKMEIERTR